MSDIDLRLPRRDVGRLLALVSERRKKVDRGVSKFAKDFDPVLGANMIESQAAFTALEQVLKEAMHEDDHPRRSRRDPRQHEGRRDAPGDNRAARREAAATQLGRTYSA